MDLEELKKRLREDIQKEQAPKKSGFFNKLKTGFDLVTKGPIGLINPSTTKPLQGLAKDVIQGTARSGAAVVKTIADQEQKINDRLFGSYEGQYRTPTVVEPLGITKKLYGDAPIQNVSGVGSETLQAFGAEGLSKNKLASSLIGATVVGLDFTTGGGKDDAIKSLVKAKDDVSVLKFLKKLKVPDDLAVKFAPDFAKANKPAQVTSLLDKLQNFPKQIDNLTKDEMIEAIDYVRLKKPFNQTIEENIGALAEKFNIKEKTLPKVADAFENLVETTKTKDISGRVLTKTSELAGKATQKALTPQIARAVKPQNLDSVLTSLPKKSVEDVSSFYNLDRLNVSNNVKQAIQGEIDGAGKLLEQTVGKTLTNKEVVKIASVTKSVLDKTVTRQQTAEKIASNLKLRQKIAAVASKGIIDDEFIELWIKDKAAGEDIARQLQARKINADPKEVGIIDLVLDAVYKQNKNADEVLAAAKGVDFNDSKQVTEFYRSFVTPKLNEWVDLLRYNSMLTSPNTHIVNAVSNFQGTGLIAPLEKTITGLIDATREALNGKPRQYAIGEGAAYAKGYYSNITKALQSFADVMKGKTLVVHPDLRNIPLATKGALKLAEKGLSFPLKLLEGMDIFFTTLTEGGIQNSLKYATTKGITRKVDIAEEAASRVFRGGSSKQGYVLNAVDSVTNLLNQARKSENPIVSTISKFTLPFVRTPTEILKQGIEYSPLGVTTLLGATNKTEQLAKVIIGTASAAGAATLLGQDRLTWAEPTNAKQKAEFRAAGRQPYSIKIGDKWVSYSKLHPALAFNFALISSIDDSQRNQRLNESEAETILSAFSKWGNFLADQSYLKNIGDFVAATKGDMGGFTKLASNYPQQLVPFRALLSWVNRIIDPVQRQADPEGSLLDRQMQSFMAQMPVFSKQVPARLGPLNQPIENQNRLLNAFSPNRITTENPSYEAIFQIKRQGRDLDRMKKDLKDSIRKEVQKSIQLGK